MITRADKIKNGKLWTVYPDADPDVIVFEGSKTACFKFLKKNFGMRTYRNGGMRIGQILWENGPKEYLDKG